MKLLILGNGFDLGHNLPTRFDDFIDSLPPLYKEKYRIFSNGDNSWNDVETKFEELLCEVMDSRSWQDLTEEVDRIRSEYGLNEYGEVNYYGYAFEGYDEELSEISDCISLLEEFEQDFLEYLRNHCADKMLKALKTKKAITQLILEVDKIITFNYTHTAEILYEPEKTIHIHGDIDDKIAIGSGALEDAKTSTIDFEYPQREKFSKDKYGLQEMMAYYTEDMEGNLVEDSFVKRFFDEVVAAAEEKETELFELLNVKSKDSLDERRDIVDLLKSERYEKVYIVGHSLGRADWSVFNSINKDALVIYYYHEGDSIIEKQCILNELGFQYEMRPDTLLYA